MQDDGRLGYCRGLGHFWAIIFPTIGAWVGFIGIRAWGQGLGSRA